MSHDASHITPKNVTECEFTFSYSANLSNIGLIRDDVLSLDDYARLDEEKKDSLIIIITELMTNAIKHGSNQDEQKNVFLGLTFTSKSVFCIIEDSGTGFDRSTIPDPTLPEYIHREHGRGIFITEHLADEVRYECVHDIMRIIVMIGTTHQNAKK